MNRTGLLIALAIAVVVGVVFGIYPDLDVRVARLFFRPDLQTPALLKAQAQMRQVVLFFINAMVAAAVLAFLLKLIMPHRRMLMPGRAVVFLIVTMALGPGLLVNVIAKDQWGRPRPFMVQPMGGSEPFFAWWDPRGTCPQNCSFVSGDVSSGFWVMAPAALTPTPWRPLAYGAAITLGSGLAVIRMMFGAHFFTDVVFAGVFTFVIIWLAFNMLYRWPATRLTDDAVERAIERLARPKFLFPRSVQKPPQQAGSDRKSTERLSD